jgi:protein-disulfide isomerase
VATKTDRKAQARAERLAREQERLDAERRRRLFWFGGAIVVVVAVVAVVIAVAGSGGGSSKSSAATTPQAATAVTRLLAGIPQDGSTLGKSTAPVTVTVFEDLECPICRDFTLSSENKLIANQVRAGRVKLVFRSLQTATADPSTFQVQQQAAVAAGKQKKQWYFVELFYHQQGAEGTPYVTESYLDKLAHQIPGLDYKAWLGTRSTANLGQVVTADERLAQSKRFSATPTIVVQGPKSSPAPVSADLDYATLSGLVKRAGG